jgi:hypothetical protein
VSDVALALKEPESPGRRETFGELVRKMEFLFEVSETSEDEAEKRYALQELDSLLLTDLPKKVDGIAWFLGHCEAEARYAEQVIERLEAAVRRHQERQQRVRDYCRQAMQTAGIRRVQGTWQALTLRAGSKSVEIVNESELPGEYWKQNPPPAPFPDKLRIRKALDAGEEVPGAALRTGPETLMVK